MLTCLGGEGAVMQGDANTMNVLPILVITRVHSVDTLVTNTPDNTLHEDDIDIVFLYFNLKYMSCHGFV